jgi:hypothetical protein
LEYILGLQSGRVKEENGFPTRDLIIRLEGSQKRVCNYLVSSTTSHRIERRGIENVEDKLNNKIHWIIRDAIFEVKTK